MRLRYLDRLLLALCLALQAGNASAYIDPGTGSALLYVVTGLVVSIYFSIRGLYYRALEALLRVRYRHQSCDLAIHCEDPRYEITFLPIVKALTERGIPSTFFTMYPRGASFEPLPPGTTHREIDPGMVGYAYLNNLEARLLVTTTPQLDVMTFRRSPRVRHYAHVQHALGESRYVRPYAFDFFDSVLCCGPTLAKNIRRMEAIRGFPAKKLYETGIPHYEDLIQRSREAPLPPVDRPIILIAPSWGPLSMFEAFGIGFVEDIARHYEVIVRPHPQMRISQPDLYQQILSLRGVIVDTQRTPSDAMSRANLLLSDISGITHEFAFIYGRPVLVVDRKMKDGGLEGELLGGDSDLKAACRDFIVPIQPNDMSRIVPRISEALANHSPVRIALVREQLIYNFGRASQVAAAQLADILQHLPDRRA